MSTIKISGLTPKDAPLSATDLLLISEVTPDGYASKSITGSEIIESAQEGRQATLISGTNIKTVNGSSLLGSGDLSIGGGISLIAKKTMVSNVGLATNVLIASEDISAHLTTSAMIQITASYRKTAGGSSSVSERFYVNTSATLTGATLIGTFASLTLVNNICDGIMNVFTDGTSLFVQVPSSASANRYGNSAGSVITIPSPCYLIWALQTPNGDTVVMLNSNVIKYA